MEIDETPSTTYSEEKNDPVSKKKRIKRPLEVARTKESIVDEDGTKMTRYTWKPQKPRSSPTNS